MNTKNLRINYHIEIINDAKTWDKFVKATESLNAPHSDAPWELYINKDFDSFEKALEYYMVWYVSDDCFDIKMWEQIFMDDEMIHEEFCEPHCCTKSEMRRIINRDNYDRLVRCERETNRLERSNKLMSGFIKLIYNRYKTRFEFKLEELFRLYEKEFDKND